MKEGTNKTYSMNKVYREIIQNLEPKFSERMAKMPRIDREHDVPYLAGYSKDGKTIYIDRHLPMRIGKVDIEPYLIEHEHTEKTLLDIGKMKYLEAHHIATMREHDKVRKDDKITPKEYEAHIRGHCKTIEHESLKKLPADLDLEPYKDMKDYAELKKIHAEQHGKSASK